MVLTTILRLLLGKQVKAFRFLSIKDYLPSMPEKGFGLYVHIPFCKEICPFCPYYKVKYDKKLLKEYIDALIEEIKIVTSRLSDKKIEVSSLYFGGGTPALAGEELIRINRVLDSFFNIKGGRGIELNPSDVNDETLRILKDAGFDMVSLGVQSFSCRLNSNLGRSLHNPQSALKKLAMSNFSVIDVDLIFGIKGQKTSDLIEDFNRAADLGATQISTYPFINFSYLKNRTKPLGMLSKKRLLKSLITVSRERGFKRNSVWTFSREGSPRYSSVTRDNFLGFGASATSLGEDSFKINVFSVEEYINSINRGELPSNLYLKFSRRSRTLYWLFWSIYNGEISGEVYYRLFKRELEKDYKITLKIGEFFSLWRKEEGVWKLTRRGSYIFHLTEQHYTNQYIDKTWRESQKNPWVKEIRLY